MKASKVCLFRGCYRRAWATITCGWQRWKASRKVGKLMVEKGHLRCALMGTVGLGNLGAAN